MHLGSPSLFSIALFLPSLTLLDQHFQETVPCVGTKKLQSITTTTAGSTGFMCSAPWKLDHSFIHNLCWLLFSSSILMQSLSRSHLCAHTLPSIKSSFCSAEWTHPVHTLLASFALHCGFPHTFTASFAYSNFTLPSHGPVQFAVLSARKLWLVYCWEVRLGCYSVHWQSLTARAGTVTLYYRTNYLCYKINQYKYGVTD